MLSKEEKMEILQDAKSKRRRRDFQAGRIKRSSGDSLDEYISFLDSVQQIFLPFKVSLTPTSSRFNKL